MDPRVRELVPIFEQFGFDTADIDEARRRFRAVCETFPRPEGVVIEERQLGGRPALSFVPSATGSDGRRILHLHGGGFVVGDVELQLMMPTLLSRATGAEVVSLDYRIAPEHPCPAATDDAVAAFLDLAGDGDVLAVAGESAGATLTLLTALALRDGGHALPGALVAISRGSIWRGRADGSATRPSTTRCSGDPSPPLLPTRGEAVGAWTTLASHRSPRSSPDCRRRCCTSAGTRSSWRTRCGWRSGWPRPASRWSCGCSPACPTCSPRIRRCHPSAISPCRRSTRS